MTAPPHFPRPAVWVIGAAIVAAIGLAAYFGRDFLTDARDFGVSEATLAAEGEPIYAAFCASCHGANLEGQPNWRTRLPTGGLPAPPHDETGHTWHHADQQLFALTKFGGQRSAPAGFQSNMPPFEGQLSDREIRAVLAYIRSRWPVTIQERQRRITERAR